MIKTITAAVVDRAQRVRSLVQPKGTDRQVTEAQVQDPQTLARLLQGALRDIAELSRRPCPRRIDFEDVEVNGDGVTLYYFPHGFAGRVRWWAVDYVGGPALLHRSEDATTDDTLALLSEIAGTVTIRVEEVGG